MATSELARQAGDDPLWAGEAFGVDANAVGGFLDEGGQVGCLVQEPPLVGRQRYGQRNAAGQCGKETVLRPTRTAGYELGYHAAPGAVAELGVGDQSGCAEEESHASAVLGEGVGVKGVEGDDRVADRVEQGEVW